MESADLNDALSADFSRFDNTGDLDLHHYDNLLIGDTEEEGEADDTVILHMDIREPLSGLKALLEHKHGIDLNGFSFCLQDAQMLEPHKNLVDQCLKGEGLVQINVQIQTINQRINIVDVLKPTEAALAALGEDVETKIKKSEVKAEENEIIHETISIEENQNSNSANSVNDTQSKKKDISPVVNWVLDNKFKKDQIRLKIPEDPNDWTTTQVKHWLQWAVRQFNLTQIKLSDWNIDGKELGKLNLEDFKLKVPSDPGNVFWTHLELLRKCKFVAIIQKVVPPTPLHDSESLDDNTIIRKSQKVIKKPMTLIKQYNMSNSAEKRKFYELFESICLSGPISMPYQEFANRSGNNGQIQLWQFLLDILTDKEHTTIIQWLGDEGEFKLNDPEKVAQLWGERKNKPAMNYEKLSRALRYYYDGDMISKVNGKRFVYKFVCDLKQLIGYNAQELSNLVNSSDGNNSWTSIKL